MNESKHTPGPWQFAHCVQNPSHAKVDCADGTAQGRLAASIFHESDSNRPMLRIGARHNDDQATERAEVIANAHLIAAAPDLLEAAKYIVFAMRDGAVFSRDYAAQRLADAIAKAEGRTCKV